MLEIYVLHVTKECNMKCVYCYEQDKTSTYTWEEIKEVLDNITKYNKHFTLEFLGGEPCLRIDLIEKTVEYLESDKNINVEGYTITTNGTLINNDLINLLKKYNKINYSFSMDGTPIMNSLRIMKNGYNSHDIVINNIKELQNNNLNNQIGCHMVTHPYNVGYLYNGVKYLYNKGIKNIDLGTIESTIIIDNDYCHTFITQCIRLSDDMRKGMFPGLNIGIFNSLKPKSDERYYIKDDNGRTLLESYGRVDNDIKDNDKYKTNPSSSNIGDTIYFIREVVYNYHNKIKDNFYNNPWLKYINNKR